MSERYTYNTNNSNSVSPVINTHVTSNEVAIYTGRVNPVYLQASRFKNIKINENIPCLDYSTTKNQFARDENLIGKGTYGEVYKGHYIPNEGEDSIPAVAKICKYSTLDDENYFTHEINSLKTLHAHQEGGCPNIIKIYAYCHKIDPDYQHKGEFIMILEYGGEFTLDDIVKENKIENPEQIFNLTFQLLEGLVYLHQPHRDLYGRQVRYIHRDLKPQNIFIQRKSDDSGGFDLKIGDLGQLRTVGNKDTQTNKHIQGTKLFMAYEIFIKFVESLETNDTKPIDPKIYTQSIDIFAAGMIIMYMINGFVPFNKRVTQMDRKIPCLPLEFPDEFRELLLKMLHTNYKTRPNAEKALKSFKNLKGKKRDMKKFNEVWRSRQAAYRNMSEQQKLNRTYCYQRPTNKIIYTEDEIIRKGQYRPITPPIQHQPISHQPGSAGRRNPVIRAPIAFRAHQMHIDCPNCNRPITSTTEFKYGCCTALAVIGLMCCGCPCCACIPLCSDGCSDVVHFCPKCNSQIGKYERHSC